MAIGQFTPTGGKLVHGTENTINANGAAAGNIGSWKGALNDDVYRWEVTFDASGLDQQLYFDNVNLNQANKFIIKIIEKSSDATVQRFYQICDWVNSANVDVTADETDCTGGGWRNLNRYDGTTRDYIDDSTERALQWHIYDGYWNTTPIATSNTPISTPLSNFIKNDSTKRILIRAYSTTNSTTALHYFDLASLQTVIDPIYYPAGYGKITGGSPTTGYISAQAPPTLISGDAATTGSDNGRFSFPGTAGEIASFYFPFKNVDTLPSFNTVVWVAEYSCSTAGMNIAPQIYNFKTGQMEDIATEAACPATASEAVQRFSFRPTVLSDYISGKEMRVGFRGSAVGTRAIQVDYAYLTIGATNSNNNSDNCFLSFGTGTAGDCDRTRDLNTTLVTSNTWQPSTEQESSHVGDYRPYDFDADDITNESAVTPIIRISNILPNEISTIGYGYVVHLRSNSTSLTLQPQLKDESGANTANMGGYTNLGTTNATATYTYMDAITNGYFASNPPDYTDRKNQTVTIRIRTSTSAITTVVVPDIDFIFISTQFVRRTVPHPPLNTQYVSTGGSLPSGNTATIEYAKTANVGSWKGTMNNDTYTWKTHPDDTTTIIDQELQFDDVRLNNANKIFVTMIASASATSLNRFYQICDWKNSTAVDNIVDSNCTGGGWRTLNKTNGTIRSAITTIAATTYRWVIYDGYWTTTPTGNTSVLTPLSNFVRPEENRVLLRTFTSGAGIHYINYVGIQPIIDSYYYPSGVIKITGGTTTGSYINAENPPTQVSGSAANAAANGQDTIYLAHPGTAGEKSDFYMTFNDVRTYEGVNTIALGMRNDCVGTAITFRPKIYNFQSGSWEYLTTANIACSTTDASNYFALSNINVNNYIRNGRILAGWEGNISSTNSIRIDWAYIALGSTVNSAADCDLSLGSNNTGSCTDTTSLDTPGTTTPWTINNEADAATRATDFYPYDGDIDAVVGEYTAALNADFSVKGPEKASFVGWGYLLRYRVNNTTQRGYYQFRDYSGLNTLTMGGWTNGGSYNATATYSVFDAPTNWYLQANANDYNDPVVGVTNIRIRTERSTTTSANTWDVDFMMVCPQWVESTGSTTSRDTQVMRHGNWFDDYGVRQNFSL